MWRLLRRGKGKVAKGRAAVQFNAALAPPPRLRGHPAGASSPRASRRRRGTAPAPGCWRRGIQTANPLESPATQLRQRTLRDGLVPGPGERRRRRCKGAGDGAKVPSLRARRRLPTVRRRYLCSPETLQRSWSKASAAFRGLRDGPATLATGRRRAIQRTRYGP
jgi:hypothetical protein